MSGGVSSPVSGAAADLVEAPCPLCGGSNLRLYAWAPSHYGPQKLRVDACRDCGMIYTNPRSRSYEEQVGRRGRLDHLFRPEMLRQKRLWGCFQLSILAKLAPGRRLLDVGAGAGALVHEAATAGWDAVGVDLNRGLVEQANEHWGFNRILALTVDQLAARRPEPFDAVVCNQIFEHLRHPLEVGQTLVSLLKPRGVICVDVPNAHQPAEWLRRGKTFDPTSHFNHFTLRTLRSLMRRMGCRVIYSSAAPSLIGMYRRLGFGKHSYWLGRLTRRLLPPIGTGVCAIGRVVRRGAVAPAGNGMSDHAIGG